MQCPRCYFTNPTGSRSCEYCGARLEPTTDAGAAGGSSAQKRKTMLGPVPDLAKPSAPVAKRTSAPIDPDDPFRIAAQGVGTPSHRAPPTVEPAQPTLSPEPPPPPPPPPRKSHRATIVTLQRPEEPNVAGAAIVVPASGAAYAVLLREGRTRIGRRDEMELKLEDPKASTDHALLRIENGTAWLLDTSANGTVVSGVPCVNDRAEVRDGTVLAVGDTHIVLKLLGEDALSHLALADGLDEAP